MSMHILKNSIRKGRVTVDIDAGDALTLKNIELLGDGLKRAIYSRFGRSFHIREVDTGSCGACESEIIACSNPLYDIQRFGIDFVASPRHADALLVTGPLSKNMKTALRKTYEAMPDPKLVITLGDCAKLGGIFKDSYYTCGGVEGALPVVLHIPGCPPEPLAIITTMVSFLRNIAAIK